MGKTPDGACTVMGSELLTVMMALSQLLETFNQCSVAGKTHTKLGKEQETR